METIAFARISLAVKHITEQLCNMRRKRIRPRVLSLNPTVPFRDAWR